jgi:hypothetical protein
MCHGWHITTDLFAAQSNTMAARFVSWTDEPNSEHVDALSLGSWNQSWVILATVHQEAGSGVRRTLGHDSH